MFLLARVVYQQHGVFGLVGGGVCLPGVRLITAAITARIVFGQGVSRNSSESVNVGRK